MPNWNSRSEKLRSQHWILIHYVALLFTALPILCIIFIKYLQQNWQEAKERVHKETNVISLNIAAKRKELLQLNESNIALKRLFQIESKEMDKLEWQMNDWIKTIPVLYFNGSNYDILLLRHYLICKLLG